MSQTHNTCKRWALADRASHPERLAGYESELIPLSGDWSYYWFRFENLRKISPWCLNAYLKVSSSTYLRLYLQQPQHLSAVWIYGSGWMRVWFAGCDSAHELKAKTLQSPLLSDINGNNQHRRDLWQQICAYD